MINKKEFIFETISIILACIFIPIVRPLINLAIIIKESHILKDIIKDYKDNLLNYKELYRYGFDRHKRNEAIKEEMINEIMKNTQSVNKQ